MARIFTTGAEANHQNVDSASASSAVTIQTSVKRSGSYAYQVASGGGNTFGWVQNIDVFSGVTQPVYGRSYLCFANLPGSTISVVQWLTTASGSLVSARLTSAGKLQLFNDVAGTQIGSNSVATIVADSATWYRVELKIKTAAGAADETELLLDGVSVASTTGLSLSDAAPGLYSTGWMSAPGANKTFYMDDIAVNDEAAGTGQTSYPGDGKVVLLLPISDNARATLWTGGAGGTTSLFEAVNNTPPIGTASETDLTQIEHGGGAAGTTDAYDANMITYTTAGIGASDTINVVQGMIVHGEDVSTGAKLLNFEVVSNPVIAVTSNFTVGDASPAALGTYPSEWGVTMSVVSYAPSVTLGTSPVMRVTRPETASRVASVCFMGMLVDYTAVVPASYLPPSRTQRTHHVRR